MSIPSLFASSSTPSSSSSGRPFLASSSKPTSTNKASTSTAVRGPEDDIPPEFIHDEIQLPCIPPERPDLRDLNDCLEALAAVFPDIQIVVFRELLGGFDPESRLALTANALLKHKVTLVKGRWKVPSGEPGGEEKDDESGDGTGIDASTNSIDSTVNGGVAPSIVPRGEIFRSAEYKAAVQALAWQEFKGLPRNTINAVIAESNFSYLEARRTLVTLASKSWRYAFSSLFMRRKPVATGDAESHPLICWRSTGQGSIIPTIRTTGSAEVDREFYDALIRPLKKKFKSEQEVRDREMAIWLNNEEAEEAEATHECACCFTTSVFEEFTHCNVDAHMICHRCVHHSMKEALFGQGWLSSINPETGTLRCMAVDRDQCAGYIPDDHLRRAMMAQDKGAEMLHKLDQRLAEHSMLAAGLKLVRCSFCSYAEVDEIYVPDHERSLRIRIAGISTLLLLAFCGLSIITTLLPISVLSLIFCCFFTSRQSIFEYLSVEWRKAMNRHRRRRRGLQFVCQNPLCKRKTCLSCNKAWTDIHVCNESSLVALRTQVEQAMSMAIKRVCPRCNTSFVKNAGCNKLTCPCGYKMCYVCRADLGEQGYRHFCDHFRPDGDPRPCTECDRCNLWESEDTDRVLLQARQEAEEKWKSQEKRDLSSTEKEFLETGVASRKRSLLMSVEYFLLRRRVPSLEEFFDILAESIFA